MPALPPVPNVLSVDLRYTDGANSNVNNRMYLHYTGSVSAADLGTFLNTVGIAWSAQIAPLVGPWLVLQEIIGNDLSSQFGAQVIHQGSIAGTATGTKLSSGACAVLSKKENDKYRGGHSRLYLPGVPDSMLGNSNTWTAAFQSTLAAAWSAFISELISTSVPAAMGTLKDVIAHRFGPPPEAPGVPRPPNAPSVPLNPPVTHDVTGYSVNPHVGSQRRRNQQSG